jgi:hypothetical protein
MKQLVNFARHERNDLNVLDRLTYAISEMSGNKFHPWNMESLDKWWQIHEADYSDWPDEEFDSAMDSFRRADCANALELFKKVLTIDVHADKSRAFAIACAVETGDIETADNLFKSFGDKKTRWAKWANIKILLAKEGAEPATKMLAGLSREYRSMGFIIPKMHVWRQIDWSLYDRLMKDEKK